jgi:hypothetical protein
MGIIGPRKRVTVLIYTCTLTYYMWQPSTDFLSGLVPYRLTVSTSALSMPILRQLLPLSTPAITVVKQWVA